MLHIMPIMLLLTRLTLDTFRIEAGKRWSTFCRRQFQMHFLQIVCCYFNWIWLYTIHTDESHADDKTRGRNVECQPW